ncbi:hypothetical protein J2W53_005132 [Pseudomonas frederiksbergensis]|nr:hypothetical protein [Pseudomonas frederiksbergensis]
MAKIIVLAGDFPQRDGEYNQGIITLKTASNPRVGSKFLVSEFKDLKVENVDSNKNIKSAIGLGIAGAMLLGPVGAVAGYLLAGRETEVTFVPRSKAARSSLLQPIAIHIEISRRDSTKKPAPAESPASSHEAPKRGLFCARI